MMGRGFPISVLTKQKLTMKSSTEGELVCVDDMMPIILWARQFLLAQGYGIVENLLLQDNKSSILLEQMVSPQLVRGQGISTSGTSSLQIGST